MNSRDILNRGRDILARGRDILTRDRVILTRGRDILARGRNLPTSWKLVLAGVVTGLSFPPVPLGFLAWIGLVPLIDAWLKSPSPSRSAWYGFLWSLGFLFVVLYWLAFNSGTYWWAAFVSMVGTVLILSVNYLFLGWLFGWLQKWLGPVSMWLLPPLWVSVEFLRSFGTLGFPWVALANSQTDFLLPIQNAEIFGIYGLSFWVVLMNVLMVELWHKGWRRRPAIGLALVLVLPWLSGWLLLPKVPEATFPVGVVQPNVNAAEKWNPKTRDQHFTQLDEMTRIVAVDSPRVVIWPEAATPAYLRRGGQGYLRQIQEDLRLLKLPVVTGMPDFKRLTDDDVQHYNAVGYIDSLGIQQQYNKIRLVPFAETIPLIFRWTRIVELLGVNLGEFTAGDRYTVFQVDGIPFSVGICFETTFPSLYRRFVLEGAAFLVGVVNDGWYNNGLATGPYQHAAQFRYRAIELRRPVVRAANTGISIVFDQAGKVVARLGLNKEGVFTARIAPATSLTFYARFGDLFAWLNVVAIIALTIVGYRKHRKAGGQDDAA